LWDSISKIPNKKRAGGVTTSSDPSTTHTHTHTHHTQKQQQKNFTLSFSSFSCLMCYWYCFTGEPWLIQKPPCVS
jgi:hypothetical protein